MITDLLCSVERMDPPSGTPPVSKRDARTRKFRQFEHHLALLTNFDDEIRELKNDLRPQITGALAAVEQVRAQVGDLHTGLDGKDADIEELYRFLDHVFQMQQMTLSGPNLQVHREAGTFEEIVANTEHKVTSITNLIEKLQLDRQQLILIRQQVDERNNKRDVLSKELFSNRTKLEALKVDLATKASVINAANSRLKELKDAIATKEARLSELKSELTAALTSMNQDEADALEEKAKVNEKIIAMRLQVKAEVKEDDEAAIKIMDEIYKKHSEYWSQKEAVTEKQASLELLTATLNLREDEQAQLTIEVEQEELRAEELSNHLAVLQETIITLSSHIRDCIKGSDELMNSTTTAFRHIDDTMLSLKQMDTTDPDGESEVDAFIEDCGATDIHMKGVNALVEELQMCRQLVQEVLQDVAGMAADALVREPHSIGIQTQLEGSAIDKMASKKEDYQRLLTEAQDLRNSVTEQDKAKQKSVKVT